MRSLALQALTSRHINPSSLGVRTAQANLLQIFRSVACGDDAAVERLLDFSAAAPEAPTRGKKAKAVEARRKPVGMKFDPLLPAKIQEEMERFLIVAKECERDAKQMDRDIDQEIQAAVAAQKQVVHERTVAAYMSAVALDDALKKKRAMDSRMTGAYVLFERNVLEINIADLEVRAALRPATAPPPPLPLLCWDCRAPQARHALTPIHAPCLPRPSPLAPQEVHRWTDPSHSLKLAMFTYGLMCDVLPRNTWLAAGYPDGGGMMRRRSTFSMLAQAATATGDGGRAYSLAPVFEERVGEWWPQVRAFVQDTRLTLQRIKQFPLDRVLLAFTRKTARAAPDPATGETAVQEVAELDVGLTWLRDEMVRAFTDAYNEAQVRYGAVRPGPARRARVRAPTVWLSPH